MKSINALESGGSIITSELNFALTSIVERVLRGIIISSRCSQLCNQYVTVKFPDYHRPSEKLWSRTWMRYAKRVSLHCRLEMKIMMMSTPSSQYCAAHGNRFCFSIMWWKRNGENMRETVLLYHLLVTMVVAAHADYIDMRCTKWARHWFCHDKMR